MAQNPSHIKYNFKNYQQWPIRLRRTLKCRNTVRDEEVIVAMRIFSTNSTRKLARFIRLKTTDHFRNDEFHHDRQKRVRSVFTMKTWNDLISSENLIFF